jgi:hypothetical protein
MRRGKATSAAPICNGMITLAKPTKSGVSEHQEHHSSMHRKDLVVLLRAEELKSWTSKFSAKKEGKHTGDQEP